MLLRCSPLRCYRLHVQVGAQRLFHTHPRPSEHQVSSLARVLRPSAELWRDLPSRVNL